jgi:hypothetical protein
LTSGWNATDIVTRTSGDADCNCACGDASGTAAAAIAVGGVGRAAAAATTRNHQLHAAEADVRAAATAGTRVNAA